ncbi:MAG TPA: hypothetical protein VMP01_05005 [Pirellulaceae bacterium]|nr:hypothetical protein [Pirellulaceae bacterium]
MTSNQIAELAEVRGVLCAFEWFNSKVNYSPTFALEELPKRPTLQEALQTHFEGNALEIETNPVVDWIHATRALFSKWLFEYRDLIAPDAFGCVNSRQAESKLVEEIVRKMERAIQPTAAWTVKVKTRQLYELFWDDLAIESDQARYLLHLGWTD